MLCDQTTFNYNFGLLHTFADSVGTQGKGVLIVSSIGDIR